jgi:hypothetical protein
MDPWNNETFKQADAPEYAYFTNVLVGKPEHLKELSFQKWIQNQQEIRSTFRYPPNKNYYQSKWIIYSDREHDQFNKGELFVYWSHSADLG